MKRPTLMDVTISGISSYNHIRIASIGPGRWDFTVQFKAATIFQRVGGFPLGRCTLTKAASLIRRRLLQCLDIYEGPCGYTNWIVAA